MLPGRDAAGFRHRILLIQIFGAQLGYGRRITRNTGPSEFDSDFLFYRRSVDQPDDDVSACRAAGCAVNGGTEAFGHLYIVNLFSVKVAVHPPPLDADLHVVPMTGLD